ncbi:hypothetical protein CRG98_029975, partial [Punica granatum]
ALCSIQAASNWQAIQASCAPNFTPRVELELKDGISVGILEKRKKLLSLQQLVDRICARTGPEPCGVGI